MCICAFWQALAVVLEEHQGIHAHSKGAALLHFKNMGLVLCMNTPTITPSVL